MEGGAVIHVVDVGKFVQHDEALEAFGKEDAIEREIDGVLLAAEEALLAGYTAAPPRTGAADLDLIYLEPELLCKRQQTRWQFAFGQGTHTFDAVTGFGFLLSRRLRLLASLLLLEFVALHHHSQAGTHRFDGTADIREDIARRYGDQDTPTTIIRRTERVTHRPDIGLDIQMTELTVGENFVYLQGIKGD